MQYDFLLAVIIFGVIPGIGFALLISSVGNNQSNKAKKIKSFLGISLLLITLILNIIIAIKGGVK